MRGELSFPNTWRIYPCTPFRCISNRSLRYPPTMIGEWFGLDQDFLANVDQIGEINKSVEIMNLFIFLIIRIEWIYR